MKFDPCFWISLEIGSQHRNLHKIRFVKLISGDFCGFVDISRNDSVKPSEDSSVVASKIPLVPPYVGEYLLSAISHNEVLQSPCA